jgi:hypothetical protein
MQSLEGIRLPGWHAVDGGSLRMLSVDGNPIHELLTHELWKWNKRFSAYLYRV